LHIDDPSPAVVEARSEKSSLRSSPARDERLNAKRTDQHLTSFFYYESAPGHPFRLPLFPFCSMSASEGRKDGSPSCDCGLCCSIPRSRR
jgi:hypothetical protein